MDCAGLYVAGGRVFRFCIRDPPSFGEVTGGFVFRPDSVSDSGSDSATGSGLNGITLANPEQCALFARLGRLRRVKINVSVQNASPFALFGLTTRVGVEECFFDVFLAKTEVSYGLSAHADYLRAIDTIV